jgi:hypothetical protein
MQENIIEHELYITKANLDSNGKMQFAAVASDTAKDSYLEEMSVGLYQSFLRYMEQGINLPIYLSLAHYPRLDGKGEAGVVTELYIDGNQLKAKGFFKDNELGTAVYNAIRKDRRDNVAPDKRVRISIGFYDRKHTHKSAGVTWDYNSNKSCTICRAKTSSSDKVYLEGILEHLAVTRVPVNKRTDIIAKSEGEDMTTRFEDALSIVGDEEIVEDVEKAFREKVGKSLEEDLITKSKNVEVIVDKILGGNSQEVVLKLFNSMTKEGKITEDELSTLVNEILNQVTPRSEVVEETEDEEETDEKKKKKKEETEDKSAVEKHDAEYQAFGGATSLADAQKAMQVAKVEQNVYYAYSLFGACAENILRSSLTVADKLSSLQALSIEFRDMLSPDRLIALSEVVNKHMEEQTVGAVEEAVKPLNEKITSLETDLETIKSKVTELSEARTASVAEETSVVAEPVVVTEDVPAWKSIVSEFDNGLTQALSNSGEARLAALQEVITKAGQDLLVLHNELATSEPVEQKSENVEDKVQKAVTKELGEVKAQISELSSVVNQLTQLIQSQQMANVRPQEKSQVTQQPNPVQKSIGINIPTDVARSSKGASISDIVNATVR